MKILMIGAMIIGVAGFASSVWLILSGNGNNIDGLIGGPIMFGIGYYGYNAIV